MPRNCQRCGHGNADEARFCLKCGALLEMEAESGEDPIIGKILLGRYRVVSVLGEGGMGKVYCAEQKMGTATRNVAIKTLHPELIGDPQLVARFHRECETVVELSHPNTVQFYDFGDLEDGSLFIVMEFIEGEDLAHVLQRGAFDPARADKIVIQICGSLQEAHQRGIVHRDLKPENVLLSDRAGQTDFVKVLDFGIAKRSEAEDGSQAKLTKQGMVLGTPPYMSPEQFSGQALDARSDIYSLGVMAYEMLTGQLPFEANTPWEWATKHLTAQPTPLEATPNGAHIPPPKRNAIMRALSKNRDERQATVLDFLHEFTGYGDAQAAWTMATSAGGMMPSGHQAAAQPRQPVGTPGPMPQTGGHLPPPAHAAGHAPYATPQPHSPHSSGGFAGYQSGSMEAGYGSGSMDAVASGGAGKIIIALVFFVFILGGGAAGGLYWWSQQDNGTALSQTRPQTPTPVQPTGSKPPGTDTPMVPTTPPEVEGDPDDAADDTADGPTGADTQDTAEADEGADEDASGDDADDGRRPPPRRSGPSAAEQAQARSMLAEGSSALDRNDIEAAIGALARAQRLVGRRDAGVRTLRSQLASKASNKVGILMQQGRCSDAQALYRRLRPVGASGPSGQHFSDDWCRRP